MPCCRPTRLAYAAFGPSPLARIGCLLAEQNLAPSAPGASALHALRGGAGAVVTGQQVVIFGGPLFTPSGRDCAGACRQATRRAIPTPPFSGWPPRPRLCRDQPRSFPARAGMRKLATQIPPIAPSSRGRSRPRHYHASWSIRHGNGWALLPPCRRWPRHGAGPDVRRGVAGLLLEAFAAQGLLVSTPSGRDSTAWERQCCARASSTPTSCTRRCSTEPRAGSRRLSRPGGRHRAIQPAVSHRREHRRAPGPQAHAAHRRRAHGLWQAGRQIFHRRSVGILDAEPERISPSALLARSFRTFCFQLRSPLAVPRRSLTSRSPPCSSSAFWAASHRPRRASPPR